MTEIIRYSKIGKEDLAIGTGTFEVTLADGRVVILNEVPLNILEGFTKALLPIAGVSGKLVRVTDSTRGVWMDQGSQYFGINGEWVNVREFGAVGDNGATDNSTAFSAALTAAGVGGRVYIPEADGFYGFSATISISSLPGITLEGAGDRSMLVNMQTGGQHLITITGSQSVKLKNFSMAGDANSGHGIYITNSSHRWLIEDIFCRNVGLDCLRVNHGLGGTLIQPRFSTNVYASSVIGPFPYAAASTVADNGVVLEASASTGTVTMLGPLIEGMGNWGVDIGMASIDTVILGGTIEGQGVGNIRTSGSGTVVLGTDVEAGGTTSSITVNTSARNARIINAFGGGSGTAGLIQVIGAANTTIEGCIVDGINIDSASSRTRIIDTDYGNNDGSIVDNGIGTVIENHHNSSNDYQQAPGKSSNSYIDFARNGGFERWLTATSLDIGSATFSIVSSATILRTGDGESDTTKYHGHYAAKVTSGAAVSGLEYQGPLPSYADINSKKKITMSVWAKTPSGTTGLDLAIYYDNGNAIHQQSFTVTTNWTRYSATFLVKPTFTTFLPRILLTSGAGQIAYFDAFSLHLGEAEPYGDGETLRELEPEPIGAHFLTFSATPTFYGDVATLQAIVLTANITGITMSNGLPGRAISIRFTQDGVGSRTVAGWPASVKLIGGAFTLTTTASKSDVLTFKWDGTNWWEISRSQNL